MFKLNHFDDSAANCKVSSLRFFSQRSESQPASKTPKLTKKMIMVASAFIFGLTPSRTLEKTFIGKVVEPGPETKLAITKSSNDNVKPKSHAANKAGEMMGRVITKKTFNGDAPKSIAASSIERSTSRNRDERMTVTKAVLKVTWAIKIVSIPLPAGQPKACSIATKRSNRERPVITSGITNGAVIMPANVKWPRNLPKRTNAREAIKPSISDIHAHKNAIFRLSQAAFKIC